jgi:hypothetical protein
MGEVTVFECDVTGDRFGAKNHVLEFDIRRHGSGPFEVRERTVHISVEATLDVVDGGVPSRIDYVGIEDGEIVGAVIPIGYGKEKTATWRERDDVVIDSYEEFFQFVEKEVLY